MEFAKEMMPITPNEAEKKKSESEINANDIIERLPTVDEEELRLEHMSSLMENYQNWSTKIESLKGEEKDRAKKEIENRIWTIIRLVRPSNDSKIKNTKEYKKERKKNLYDALWKKYDRDLMGLMRPDTIIDKIPSVNRQINTPDVADRYINAFKRSREDFKYIKGENRIRFKESFDKNIGNAIKEIGYWKDKGQTLRRLRAELSRVK